MSPEVLAESSSGDGESDMAIDVLLVLLILLVIYLLYAVINPERF